MHAVKIASLNVLADAWAHHAVTAFPDNRFTDSKKNHSISNDRTNNLLVAILQRNPDIICIQELDNPRRDAFITRLGQKGYACEVPTPNGGRPDGCAIFYKRSFTKVNALILNYPDTSNRHAIFLTLDINGSRFVIATTHLQGGPLSQTVKHNQFEALAQQISMMAHLPIIVTGDLNTEPQDLPDLITRLVEDTLPPHFTTTLSPDGQKALRLDYMLVSAQVQGVPGQQHRVQTIGCAKSTSAVKSTLMTNANPTDHLPLEGVFGIRAAQPQLAIPLQPAKPNPKQESGCTIS